MSERRENRDRRVLAREYVGERDTHFHGIAFAFAGDGHPAALRLHHEVVARAVALRAESRDRAPDETGVAREKRGRIDPMALECSAAEVVDHDVRICREALDLPLCLRITDVERDPE